jgi:hypothetical protein
VCPGSLNLEGAGCRRRHFQGAANDFDGAQCRVCPLRAGLHVLSMKGLTRERRCYGLQGKRGTLYARYRVYSGCGACPSEPNAVASNAWPNWFWVP